jgi:asparagine synthase (glutamine-hydrolysing)
MFEQENAGVTPYPLEVRYPFLDLRIVNYLLAIPPFPWFFEKMILREAMAGRIPERIRMRPKTPFEGDPVSAQLQKNGAERANQMPWSKDSDRFVDRTALTPLHDKMSIEKLRSQVRPFCLNVWLESARRVGYNKHAEAGNGEAR